MTTLAEDSTPPRDAALRALHDALEGAYFGLARGSSRWYERVAPEAVMGGFAGLDSPTMSRVALLAARDERGLDAVLADAGRFFEERRVPWSVQVTPFARPVGIERLLEARGFALALELSVMTLSPLAEAAAPRADSERASVRVREVREEDVARFTALTVDAFRMPARFQTPLLEVNQSWMRAGARAFFAMEGGEPIGTALLAPGRDVTGVYNVATLRPWRRRGVARQLMAHLTRLHSESGRKWLTLQVATGSPAEALYKNLGFEARYAWRLFAR